MIEAACHALHTQVEGIAVFQEQHKSGQRHYHAIVIFPAKAGRIWQLDQKVFDLHGAKTYTEVQIFARPPPPTPPCTPYLKGKKEKVPARTTRVGAITSNGQNEHSRKVIVHQIQKAANKATQEGTAPY